MEFLKLMQSRYTAKHYDPSRTVSREDLDSILECARLAPSSVNLQPWHFYVAYGPEAIKRVMPALMDFNQERVGNASAVIAICANTKIVEEKFARVLEKEQNDGRFQTPEDANAMENGRRRFVGMHSVSDKELLSWTTRQSYIALATIMYAAASLGIDSTPLEGYYPEAADDLLSIKSKNLHCVCMLSLGYRAADDTNTIDKRPKSRMNTEDVITYI